MVRVRREASVRNSDDDTTSYDETFRTYNSDASSRSYYTTTSSEGEGVSWGQDVSSDRMRSDSEQSVTEYPDGRRPSWKDKWRRRISLGISSQPRSISSLKAESRRGSTIGELVHEVDDDLHEWDEDLLETRWLQGPRNKMWIFFEDSNSSRWAKYFAYVNYAVISVSSVFFVLETVPDLRDETMLWETTEYAAIVFFTAELLLRIFACPNLAKFSKDFLNWVDLLSILPFYLELALASAETSASSARVLRTLRLTRIIRVLKFSRYTVMMRSVLKNTFKSSQGVLAMTFFMVMIVVSFFSALMFFAERGEYNSEKKNFYRSGESDPSPFRSIPHSFWWCFTTVTTVGYGVPDVPLTGPGKLIAVVTMVIGILVIAVPISVLSANFSTYRQRLQEQEKMALEAEQPDWDALFQFDVNRVEGTQAIVDPPAFTVLSAEFESEKARFDAALRKMKEMSAEMSELIQSAQGAQLNMVRHTAGMIQILEKHARTSGVRKKSFVNMAAAATENVQGEAPHSHPQPSSTPQPQRPPLGRRSGVSI
eukprot:GFYU01005632.1.p1 GENE.GFYU01005632.1~~GFYU01005632.1.p1  ORF type:complete len:539 (-),score=91.70 GFYU01005632.1:222-1838(-)